MRKVFTTVLVMIGIIGGVALGVVGAQALPLFGSSSSLESRSSEIIESVTNEEEVVLIGLGIQGIEVAEGSNGDFGWLQVPGTERKTFLQYSFTAKLGIDGGEVRISEVSPKRYRITIPEFIFVGYEMRPFESAIEQNGVLSWMTEEIDTVDMTNRILGKEKRAEYIDLHEEDLRAQAEVFYESIISGIDPEIVVEFEHKSL